MNTTPASTGFQAIAGKRETKKADGLTRKGSEISEEDTIEAIYGSLQEYLSKWEKAAGNLIKNGLSNIPDC